MSNLSFLVNYPIKVIIPMVKPTMLNYVQDVEACLSDVFPHKERVHALNMFVEAKKKKSASSE